jgi:S1-C subfamily serine protease
MENNYNLRRFIVLSAIISIICGTIFGGAAGFLVGFSASQTRPLVNWVRENIFHQPAIDNSPGSATRVVVEDSAVITAVEHVSPAVVSIIVSKDLPKIQQYNYGPFGSDFFNQFFGGGIQIPQNQPNSTQKQEVGGGTGFVVSADGYIVTNKHVAVDSAAEYTVLMNDGKKYPAKVMALDPVNDLAVLKIEANNLPTVELGDSSGIKVGQTVIAIGNALGEFRNTVSRGVISGLARSVTAGGVGFGSENLSGVIQTDASINPGNSGGPLLNLDGQVIGINTAIAEGAQNIGFAIPINELKKSIESVKQTGRIVRPWLGVRYVMLNKDIATANKLTTDYGALVVRGTAQTDLAVVPGSPADKAGIVENDIILEINGRKLDENNQLANVLGQFAPGDQITLKIEHDGAEKTVTVKLTEMK